MGPHIVGAVGTADVHLLPVDNIVVAIATGGGFGVGQVGAGLGLGQQLPGADFALEYLGQKILLLFLGTPYQNGIPAEASAGVVVGRKREVVPVDFLLQDNRVVDGQAAAAVFPRSGGPKPTLFAESPAQFTAQLVLLVGQVD